MYTISYKQANSTICKDIFVAFVMGGRGEGVAGLVYGFSRMENIQCQVCEVLDLKTEC